MREQLSPGWAERSPDVMLGVCKILASINTVVGKIQDWWDIQNNNLRA